MRDEFYPMAFEAWDEGTDDLTLEQEAAYLRLCHQMYRRGGPINATPQTCARLFRCHPNKAKTLLESLVGLGKVYWSSPERLSNTRVEEELVERTRRSHAARDKGRRGGHASGVSRANALKEHDRDEASASSGVKQIEPITGQDKTEQDIGLEPPAKLAPSPSKRSGRKPPEPPAPTPAVTPPSPSPSGGEADNVVPIKPKSKGTRLQPDWKPTPGDWSVALACGLTEVEAAREVPKFRDYWAAQPGQKGVKADWPATWRNWVRRTAERLGRQPAPEPPNLFAGGRVEQRTETEIWTDRLAQYARTQFWPDDWGPQPGERGCRVPKQLLPDARDVKFD